MSSRPRGTAPGNVQRLAALQTQMQYLLVVLKRRIPGKCLRMRHLQVVYAARFRRGQPAPGEHRRPELDVKVVTPATYQFGVRLGPPAGVPRIGTPAELELTGICARHLCPEIGRA